MASGRFLLKLPNARSSGPLIKGAAAADLRARAFDEVVEEARLEGPESLLFFTEERRLGLTLPPSLGRVQSKASAALLRRFTPK
jgi:hypothetical protein